MWLGAGGLLWPAEGVDEVFGVEVVVVVGIVGEEPFEGGAGFEVSAVSRRLPSGRTRYSFPLGASHMYVPAEIWWTTNPLS
jgi:hypothetical protein